jgi:putative CocE/NonD family hydrolase
MTEKAFGSYAAPAPRYAGTRTSSFYIPMRDGVELAVEVILPEDLEAGARIPALLSQTRYWRAKEMRVPFKWFLTPEVLEPDDRDLKLFFTSQGYALVLLDVRGTGASFGAWPHPWPDDSVSDAADVVDWIVSQPWSDGNVGGYGISYVGTTAELLAVPDHPAVKAVIPMFNHPDAFTDIAFPGGIFHQRFTKSWSDFDRNLDRNVVPEEFGFLGRLLLRGVKPVDGDRGRRLLRKAVREHASNGHAFSLARPLDYRDSRPEGIELTVEAVTVHRFKKEIEGSRAISFGWGSWMDAGTADAVIRRFLTFDNAGGGTIGAWEHCGRFNASPYRSPDAPPSPTLRQQWCEMLRFFDERLKVADHPDEGERTLFYYTMGEEKWQATSVWPPEGTALQRWHLAADGELSPGEPDAETGSDSYTVDFEANTGESNRWWEMGAVVGKTVVYGDRSGAASHLLTYTTPPLARDLEITGYPVVTLYVTSTHEDVALFVYVEDVDETGRVFYATEGQLRALHRRVSSEPSPYRLQVPYHSFREEDAMPLVPGELAEITFGLHPTSVLIRKGHRIRVGIAGHDQGTFVRIPAEGTPVITIARNRVHASCIDLPAVGRG